MEDWIEEDIDLRRGDVHPAEPKVLDQRVLHEAIRILSPRAPIALPLDGTTAQAVAVMREHRVGCVLVVDDERLVGIVTERDLLLKLDREHLDRPLSEIMTPDPETLRLDDPIVYALNRMSVGGFRHVPLVDGERRPVGVVSVKDIVDYIVDFFPNDVLTVPPDPDRGSGWRGRDGG